MRAAYRRYLAARCLPARDGADTREALQGMQAAVLDALRAGEPLPDEMRLHLAFALENVCAGIADPLLSPISKPGGREAPIAKACQEGAIRYLRWCEDGRIHDPAPVATVAKAFDVVERAITGWRRAWRDRETPKLSEAFFTPEDDFDPAEVAAAVRDLMLADGRVYRRFIKKPKARTPR
jgi:transposase-like protein